jgi:hypothetical protein
LRTATPLKSLESSASGRIFSARTGSGLVPEAALVCNRESIVGADGIGRERQIDVVFGSLNAGLQAVPGKRTGVTWREDENILTNEGGACAAGGRSG